MAIEAVGTQCQRRILAALNTAISRIYELDAGQGGKGGFFRLFSIDPTEGLTSMRSVMPPTWIGGTANRASDGKYMLLSFEKAVRLGYHIADGHLTSAQSADPDRGRYQGAVWMRAQMPGVANGAMTAFIASISGFPSRFDEQLAVVALLSEHAALDEARLIMGASGNTLDIWPPV